MGKLESYGVTKLSQNNGISPLKHEELLEINGGVLGTLGALAESWYNTAKAAHSLVHGMVEGFVSGAEEMIKANK
jgi:hypothetical protein